MKTNTRSIAGFTLVELVITVGVISVVMVGATAVMPGMLTSSKSDGSAMLVLNTLRLARDRAIGERRNMELVFTAPNHIQVVREEIGGLATNPVIMDVYLENGQKFLKFTGLADTPDHFGLGQQPSGIRSDSGKPADHHVHQRGNARGQHWRPHKRNRVCRNSGQPGFGARNHHLRADRVGPCVAVGWSEVGGMSGKRTMRNVTHQSADGFSLIEVVVATGILATGLLSLAGVFSLGMLHMAGSTPGVIAREKAREAVESVHTARDTGKTPWAKIKNTPAPGVFLIGPQPLYAPGLDGLANTADDAAAGLEKLAGTDNIWARRTTCRSRTSRGKFKSPTCSWITHRRS